MGTACSRAVTTHCNVTVCDRRGMVRIWDAAPPTPGREDNRGHDERTYWCTAYDRALVASEAVI
jgi:hypothetical protein